MLSAPRAERQAQIVSRRAAAATGYATLWAQVTSAWRQPGDDRLWLVYAANYLCRTRGVRWALDPLALRQRVPQVPAIDLSPLKALSFVLLTHRHADHLDLDLIRGLRGMPIRWVIPELLLPGIFEQAGLAESQVIVPRPFQPIPIGDMRITPFDGLHWEPQPASGCAPRGVPAMGYLVEFNGRRWLFPGDVRDYFQPLPDFGPLEGVFAHLWLGRGAALLSDPPLLEAFSAFYARLPARWVIVTHLHELGREPEDYWGEGHYTAAAARLRQLNPALQVECAVMGQSLVL